MSMEASSTIGRQDLMLASAPHRAMQADEGLRCACPACSGAITVTSSDGGDGPQAYLNADARGGVAPNGKVSFSIDRAAIQMTGFDPQTGTPYPGWSHAAGVGFTVTYAFRSTAPADMPDDAEGFSRFNEAQIIQAELALQAWADVANIKFVRVGSGSTGEGAYSNSASMLFGNYSSGVEGASAFAMFPGDTSFNSASGDVWVRAGGSNSSPSPNNYGGHVLVHEIGHAIGLTHPGDYNADADTEFTYAAHAEYYEDSGQYTVMSYFDETETGANFFGKYASVPLLDDIAAAQVEYGPNWNTRTGDTTYGFNSNAERAWFAATNSTTKLVFAVWDAGGKDTFDFSGYFQNQVIELREGFFSNVGGLVGNVAVAKGAVIENARGGSGADKITGNASANTLHGGAGGDTLSGREGQDFLRGEDGNDLLTGGEAFDDLHGNWGEDTVYGGMGGDWVVGGQGNDRLFGEDDHDVVYGNLGNDFQEGGVGNDWVRGGQGDDELFGGAGDDYMAGDRGSDTISGGSGADLFHTFSGAGIDRVTDFNYAEGDRVNVLAGSTYTVYQSGADTIVDMGGGDRMILVGVSQASLGAGWIFS